MTKYTEAIIDKVDLIQRCERSLEYYRNDRSLFPILKKELEDARIDLEALQIADRLEQITENGTNRITEVLCKDCREKELLEALGGCQGICRAMSNVIDGYNQALTDLRGEE